jgi:hypothetical protein
MRDFVSATRSLLEATGDRTGLPESFSGEYLRWMTDTVDLEEGWPRDKKVRWLGFVRGAAFVNLYGVGVHWAADMVSSAGEISSPDADLSRERVLGEANSTALEGLRARCAGGARSDFLRLLDIVSSTSASAAAKSFCLGYLQAIAVSLGLVDVASERDRTRPIYHAAYAACGYDIPKKRDKE